MTLLESDWKKIEKYLDKDNPKYGKIVLVSDAPAHIKKLAAKMEKIIIEANKY